MRVGVLALQGDFAAHRRSLEAAAVSLVENGAMAPQVEEVRRVDALEGLAGLIIPGGESTTLLKLMGYEPWFDGLRRFQSDGGVLMGTCAGAILLAAQVSDPQQESLGLLDVTIRRNGYGRQIDSFEADIAVRGWDRAMRAVFIRAPRFQKLGTGVEVLAEHAGEPVLVQQGRVVAATFHPELTKDHRLHRLFLDSVVGAQGQSKARGDIQGLGCQAAAGMGMEA